MDARDIEMTEDGDVVLTAPRCNFLAEMSLANVASKRWKLKTWIAPNQPEGMAVAESSDLLDIESDTIKADLMPTYDPHPVHSYNWMTIGAGHEFSEDYPCAWHQAQLDAYLKEDPIRTISTVKYGKANAKRYDIKVLQKKMAGHNLLNRQSSRA